MKVLIKYITITVCGLILFVIVNRAACPMRSTPSIGGEGFFLISPLFWWITERTVKDLADGFKRLWREVKQEYGKPAQVPESDNDHGSNEKRPRA